MIGAIAGDIAGSIYEFRVRKREDIPIFTKDSFFTDDSVMTIATAEAILHQSSYQEAYRKYGHLYPYAGYGGMFREWLVSDQPKPYNSFGNGSAMRVSAVGWAFDTIDEVLAESEKSAAPTHDHPEGIKGAQATALAILLARQGKKKEEIRSVLTEKFGYDLNRTVESIRPDYQFNETCQQTVPEALIAFFDASDYEDTLRKAISLGGDADTLACIAGSVAEAYYAGIPQVMIEEVVKRLPSDLLEVVEQFRKRYLKTLYSESWV
jgi:ADP-ribosylglycohydrolase